MDFLMTLLNAMPGAVAQGLIWGIMAIGVYVTFRILDIADLTVDGTMCTGAAVCIMMMLAGYNVVVSLIAATLAGMAAGLLTGIFHTFMGIPAILAGILTQLSLYSINLKIMTKANQSINVDNSDLLISLRYIKGVPFSRIRFLSWQCLLWRWWRLFTGFSGRSWDPRCVPPAAIPAWRGHRESTPGLTRCWD